MKLSSYLSGEWVEGRGAGRALVNPVTGEEIARADASGLDLSRAMHHARKQGGAALAGLSFAARGAILKAIADVLIAHRAEYEEIARHNSGNTAVDAAIDIDGGIGTLKYYARLGQGLGDATRLVEAGQDQLARDPVFFARHFWTTRPGVAVQVNAFNFPSWGMWEKVAQATLAGVPSLAKPATATALLSWRMMRDVIEAGVTPPGMLSLLCGGGEGLVDVLGPMDSLAFTGSAATARSFRQAMASRELPPRLTVEADSVNATILGPDAGPGSALFDLAVWEAVKALSVKAGQLCTNIRRILVPKAFEADFSAALAAKVEALVVGDPALESTRVGPVINLAQKDEALANLERLSAETQIVAEAKLPDFGPNAAFVAPTLMRCDDPASAHAVHTVEVFGPCATILPYDGVAQAVGLGKAGEGSLALSLFSNDPAVQQAALSGLGPWHGRLLMVDDVVGKAHTGHAIVMPQCVHGGPGRAGGGEELGGVRGLRFHMQRSAVQASPNALEGLVAQAAEAVV